MRANVDKHYVPRFSRIERTSNYKTNIIIDPLSKSLVRFFTLGIGGILATFIELGIIHISILAWKTTLNDSAGTNGTPSFYSLALVKDRSSKWLLIDVKKVKRESAETSIAHVCLFFQI